MEKVQFDYYDWNEFEQFLNHLPDKDAAKLIATIQNIEANGLILEVAVKIRTLRENMGMNHENMGMNQRDFAKLVGKPQSTIARIENGTMNVSTKVLSEIAQATKQRLTIQFTPVFKIYF